MKLMSGKRKKTPQNKFKFIAYRSKPLKQNLNLNHYIINLRTQSALVLNTVHTYGNKLNSAIAVFQLK